MSPLLALAVIALAVAAAGFYSGSETAAYGASQARLNHLALDGDRRAQLSLRLLAGLPALVTATLIGHNLAVYLATYSLTSCLESRGVTEAELWATLALTPACFIFAEVLPKRLAHAAPERFLLRAAEPLSLSRAAFRPLGAALRAMAWLLNRLLKLGDSAQVASGRRKLLEHFEAGLAENLLSESQHLMARRIMVIEEMRAVDVMIPLAKAFMLREDCQCLEAARAMHDAGHRRALLCNRAGTPTGGMVTLNAIMRAVPTAGQPVSTLAREAVTVDQRSSVARTIARLRARRAHLAIVTGKRGAPVGIVTANLLLGNIVGAIKF